MTFVSNETKAKIVMYSFNGFHQSTSAAHCVASTQAISDFIDTCTEQAIDLVNLTKNMTYMFWCSFLFFISLFEYYGVCLLFIFSSLFLVRLCAGINNILFINVIILWPARKLWLVLWTGFIDFVNTNVQNKIQT